MVNITEGQPILEMRRITKDYPGVRALDSVDFSIYEGEVHALVGENGAGKSTLMKVLAGAERKDAGEIYLEGRRVEITSPLRSIELGIAIIYQEFNLVPHLSVAENIFLGREFKGALGFIDWSRMYAESRKCLEQIGADVDVKTKVINLSVAQQQMAEIAKAISISARIIAMDEPSATLTEHELHNLFALIKRLKEKGVSIVYISHRLEEIFVVADRVTVLRDGKLIETNNIADVDREAVIRMMVGRELKDKIPKKFVKIGEPVLRVEGLGRRGVLEGINFGLRKGEVLGVAGLVGAGRTEMARMIFGADEKDSGEIYLEGKRVDIKSPEDAISLGIALMPEDRKRYGLILGMVVRENISLANLNSLTKLGFIARKEEEEVANRFIADLMIKTPSTEQQVRNLSGGTQQKVVLAKWLFTKSKVLIFDEPTRGIDVGAKVEIYQLMNQLVERGVGIIMISSELPEILGMSDRIVVMHEGRIAGELTRGEATQEKIMSLATGGG